MSPTSGVGTGTPGTTYILTATEASNVLKCEIDDPTMLALLPAIDAYIVRATGHDWAADTTIPQEAKSAARILLVQWHEDPGMMAGGTVVLSAGLTACLAQLEAMALYYYIFEGIDGAGSITLSAAMEGDTVVSLVGKVGASGDQSAKFETVITEDGSIQQTSSDDLSEIYFQVKLVPPSEM